MFKHNDYEIIDYIKEGNQDALSLLFEKYKPLISKKIMQFNLQYQYDDMVQEAHMILLKSLRKFDEKYNKTFTRYFEQNLHRYYISTVTKEVRRNEIYQEYEWVIYETMHHTPKNDGYKELILRDIEKILTNLEYMVYTLREVQNFSVEYITKTYKLDEKVVYNSLHRAKSKIKSHFKQR